MPDPFLHDLTRRPLDEVINEFDASQERQREMVERLRREREAEHSSIRAHRYADDTEHGHLEGEEAAALIEERSREHLARQRAVLEEDREAERELTPIQIEVARGMQLSPAAALSLVRGGNVSAVIQRHFLLKVELERRRQRAKTRANAKPRTRRR
jgi:hypothetical protein